MDYDYSKLTGKIREIFGRQVAFAEAMGMGESTLSLKLNNRAEWSQAEMSKAMDLLLIDPAEVRLYFFTHRV